MTALYWIFGVIAAFEVIAKIALTPTSDAGERLGVAIGCALGGVMAWLLIVEAMSR